ncbi:MAG: NRDE family protein [Myxococcales bacterium]|nr:NRDE family protein [Myxococcales bacterium]
MCTIALIHRIRPDQPLVVAANRDEFYARPATGPQVLDPRLGVVGGRDHKGGTWLGLTKNGLFVGLTNQRTSEDPPADARSRGEAVLEALRAGAGANGDRSARALDRVMAMRAGDFPPFNLVLGDGERLFVAYARRDGWESRELEPGVWVLANDRLGSPWFPKAERLQAKVTKVADAPWPTLRAELEHALADTTVPEDVPIDPTSPVPAAWARALQALCIHTEVYGTRSATIAALGRGAVAEYAFAEGPPDENPFRDFTPLVSGA